MKLSKIVPAVVAVGLAMSLGFAEPPKAPGSVKATIQDSNNAPVEGISARLEMPPIDRSSAGTGGNAAPMSMFEPAGRTVQTKKSDASGKVEFTNIKPGRYRVFAASPKLGRGSESVNVESGKAAEVTVTLKVESKK